MGPPVRPIVANLYREHFEREALQSASTPRYWFWFVDDTFVIQQHAHKQSSLYDINSIDPAIKFTVEDNQENGSIPFLDTLVTPEADNSLSIRVHHKPNHTDKYLQWDSQHNLAAKYSVIGTLTYKAKTACTKPELFQREIQHLREALVKCKYPRWAINEVQSKYINNNWGDKNNQQDNSTHGNNNPSGNTEVGPHQGKTQCR